MKNINQFLEEKAVSKKQQRFMGMVHAVQKGDMKAPSPAIAKAAKSMKKKDVKDFAETKHDGLPEKKKPKKKTVKENVEPSKDWTKNPTIQKVVKFLVSNQNPSDDQVHKFAEEEKINVHQLESVFYFLATKTANMLSGGRSAEKGITEADVDPKELAMGIKVEFEHCKCLHIAKKIALDHLAELPDYYSRLAKMESEGEAQTETIQESFKPSIKESKIVKECGVPLKVMPIVVKKVMEPREIEYCPHCGEEILEKSMFCIPQGDDWYFYHRGDCAKKAPIKLITKADSEKALRDAGWNLG